MSERTGIVSAARGIVRVLLWLNIIFATAFLATLIASFAFEPAIVARLLAKYGAAFDAARAVVAFRLLLLIGIAAGVVVHPLFRALLAILTTLADGDPFVSENARRVARIGWALLALQLLDLALGATEYWLSRTGAESLGWSPSLSGWIAVLVAFVLARVFVVGTRMRDEIEATI